MNKNSINFLGIGAQKSATSWLWKVLHEHDDIWMPPRKELHYFDRSLRYPSPSFLATDKLSDRLTNKEPNNMLFRNKLLTELGMIIDRKQGNIEWYSKYFLGTYNDEWYKSLFEEGKEKVSGEITPAYSILNKEDIAHIKTLFPELKIILILRNPIERAWSQARFYMTRNLFDINKDIDKLKEFIDSDIQTTRGDYLSIINNWSSVFSKEDFFIGFYDEIEEDNKKFISKICDFLKIEKDSIMQKDILNKKVNVSIELEIPDEIEKYLIEKYYNDIEKLSISFEKYPTKWLNDIKYHNR